ncbi:MAG: DUF938 domain-containing protein [Burkholderiales bacterium]
MDKPHAPSTARNRDPILAVLREVFAGRRSVLEIGSGTGEHAVHFAAALPQLRWQTSERAECLPGLRLWTDETSLPNLPPPIELDVDGAWPAGRYDAVFTSNTLHILHWDQVVRLFERLASVLAPDAVVAIYGPFNRDGRYTTESNAAFDASLRAVDPLRGLRDVAQVAALARAAGLALVGERAMPANNLTLVFRTAVASAPPAS